VKRSLDRARAFIDLQRPPDPTRQRSPSAVHSSRDSRSSATHVRLASARQRCRLRALNRTFNPQTKSRNGRCPLDAALFSVAQPFVPTSISSSTAGHSSARSRVPRGDSTTFESALEGPMAILAHTVIPALLLDDGASPNLHLVANTTKCGRVARFRFGVLHPPCARAREASFGRLRRSSTLLERAWRKGHMSECAIRNGSLARAHLVVRMIDGAIK
jgi:hypothetical protein